MSKIVAFIEGSDVHLAGGLVVQRAWLKSERALAKKFVRAAYKGFRHAKDKRGDAIGFMVRNSGMSEKLAARMYDTARPGMTEDWAVGVKEQQKTMNLVLALQGMKKGPPLKDVYDFSLVKEVSAELKAKGWRP